MHISEKSLGVGNTPSSIVRIAYHQLSIMSGFEDPTMKENNNNEENLTMSKTQDRMQCTKRLFRLPIFVSVTSSVSDVYTAVKESHESLTTVFDNVENRLTEGIEYISPITGRVSDALETPLKVVDDAVCVGLDFLEGKLHSVKLPSYEVYENFTNYLSSTFQQAMERVNNLYNILVTQIEQLAITNPEISESETQNGATNLNNIK